MPIDIDDLGRRVASHGQVARVLIVKTSGSAPREAGAEMLVWKNGQSGTIGGGALEFEAAEEARKLLGASPGGTRIVRKPLGPGLGQCCGGSVTLSTEIFDDKGFDELAAGLKGKRHRLHRTLLGADAPPDGLRSAAEEEPDRTHFADGWLAEPAERKPRQIWLYGAGHVGRAVVDVLAPFAEFEIVWVDMAAERFPARIPQSVKRFLSESPANAVAYAPANAEHVIMTHSHAIDLDICCRILSLPFRSAGLIGSKSKWSRFRKRLSEAGFADREIGRIACPIGIPELGKLPHAIAVGLACSLIRGEMSGKAGANHI